MADNNDNIRSTLAQVLAILMYSLVNFGLGMAILMPTVVIGALRTDQSALGLSKEQASWFGGFELLSAASLTFIVHPVASVLSGFLQSVWGHRKCLMLVNIPMLVGWLILYRATSVTHLFVAQVIMGVSIGFVDAPLANYVGEITQPRLRGVLSSVGPLFTNSGFVLESVLGAVLPWRDMVLYSMLAPVASFVVMIMAPDSPTWLVTKGRKEEAVKAYQWLRGWVSPEDVQEELDSLVNYVSQCSASNSNYTAVPTEEGEVSKRTPAPFWRTLLEPDVLVAFRIIMISCTVIACVSLLAIRTFFIEVLNDMKLPYDSKFILVLLLTVQTCGVVSIGVGFKLVGKRRLTFVGLSANILCCFGMTAYLQLGADLPWLPVLLFGGSYFFGAIMIVRFVLITELLPLRARGLGGGICAAWFFISVFLVVKTYYHLAAVLGVAGVCFVYGVVGLLGLAYLYWDLPETEGLSLENIERRMAERRSNRSQKTILNGSNKKEDTTNMI